MHSFFVSEFAMRNVRNHNSDLSRLLAAVEPPRWLSHPGIRALAEPRPSPQPPNPPPIDEPTRPTKVQGSETPRSLLAIRARGLEV